MSTPDLLDHLPHVLALMRRGPFGLITDIDGTLAEIAPTPEEARVSTICRRALAGLVGRIALVAAISGRTAQEARKLVGVEEMLYLGNHGMERWRDGGVEILPEARQHNGEVAKALAELRELLPIEGLRFEDRGVVGAVHYRNCSDRQGVRKAILQAITNAPAAQGLKITQVKMLIELRAPGATHKGTAIQQLVRDWALKSALFLGDDYTDLDGFDAISQLRQTGRCQGLGIAVVDKETPGQVIEAADFILPGVAGVERFLHWLVQNAPP